MKGIEILPAEPQQNWGWPATANFVLGGAGSGYYLFRFLVALQEQGSLAISAQIPYGLLGPALAALGFFALTTEAGHPLRGAYLFRNLCRAWLSRETLFCSIFATAVMIDWLIPSSVFRILSVAAALALMVSQGFLLYQIRAIAAWRIPVLPLFFISSGFASGGGVVLLLSGLTQSKLQLTTVAIGAVCLGANLVIWLCYVYWLLRIGFWDAPKKLRRPIAPIITVGVGHVFPLSVLFLVAVRNPSESNGPLLLEAVSGFAILLGAVFQKTAIVVKLSQLKPITIDASEN